MTERAIRFAVLATVAWASISAGHAQQRAQTGTAAAPQTRPHVETLASPRLDGRLAGSNGERLAGDYIVSELRKIGARPLPGQRDFLMPFEFTAGTRDGGSRLDLTEVRGTKSFAAPTDVQALSFSDNADVSGPVVFAGYGIVVPESQGFGYDSYAGLDVKDKIVLVLRYFPEDADTKTKQILARYSDLRYKALAARQRGARALLVATGPRSPNAGGIVPMSFDTAIAGSGITAASISGAVADALFGTLLATTLESTQRELDSGNPHVAGIAFRDDVKVSIHAAVVRQKQTARNIVAYLPATTSTSGISKPWVALGAHYDHLGRGTDGTSLARQGESGLPHLGADDNASGSAAVLAAGAVLAGQPRSRNIILAWWSGEEEGLLGSAAFVAAPPVPVDQLAAYFNFDMVGRMQDNRLFVQAVGSSASWGRLIEQANVAAGFDLTTHQDPYQPTDVASFNLAGVPCLNFFTGTHVDYHRPTDTAEKINFADLDRVVTFAASIVRRVADTPEAPQFTKVEQQLQPGGGRAAVRVFTGTIPDYATEIKGLLLGGVVGGGPAEKAGLQKGDIIIEIAGQSITNIYDYTYALEILKVDQPSKVVYTRNGQRRETLLTPTARR